MQSRVCIINYEFKLHMLANVCVLSEGGGGGGGFDSSRDDIALKSFFFHKYR
jgi:hypothetical protein